MLRGRDVQELKELQRQGMSIQAISELTGWDRKTIRKGTTPEPIHREIYATLQIPAEVMKPVKTWHEPTT